MGETEFSSSIGFYGLPSSKMIDDDAPPDVTQDEDTKPLLKAPLPSTARPVERAQKGGCCSLSKKPQTPGSTP